MQESRVSHVLDIAIGRVDLFMTSNLFLPFTLLLPSFPSLSPTSLLVVLSITGTVIQYEVWLPMIDPYIR